jgi:hypothetical protein
MDLYKKFSQLCAPAALYFVVSLLALLLVILQNLQNRHTLCVGNYSCPVPSVTLIFLMNLVYILFWSWILHLICKAGWKWLSWALVLFPFVVVFLLVILGMSQN